MEILKELSLIINRNKAKSIEVLDLKRRKESKINEFYIGLTDGTFESDEAAANFFYPGKTGGSNYRKLKAALKSRMINSLFFIDVKKNSYTDRQTAYYECYKDWAAANILLGKTAYKSCIDLCNKILRYAQKYEFTELARDVTKVLRLHYGTQLGDTKKYKYFRDLHDFYYEQCAWEDRAERYYSDLIVEYVNSKASKVHLYEDACKYIAALKDAMDQIDSYRLHLYGRLIELVACSIKNDFSAVEQVAQSMACFFENKDYKAATPLQAAYYYQLVACTQLKKYEAGKQVADKCLDLLDEGSFNWFKYYELYFILSMHTKQYDEAFAIYNRIQSHARMKFLPDNIKETWTLYGAYVHYLLENKTIVLKQGIEPLKFRLGRFLNETPILSKDKRGMNIAILVVQILFFIQQGKYYVAIDKIEAIEKYCTRYLHKPETIRSYYFIKMLLTVPQANFHKVAVERKSKNYAKKLEATPLQEASQTYKIEIIPYETLWQMVMNALGNKSYTARKLKLEQPECA